MEKQNVAFRFMKMSRIIFLCVLIISFWNCAESDMEFENEVQLVASAGISDRRIDKLLAEDTPVNLRLATKFLANNFMGKKLFKQLESFSDIKIRFKLLLDENGEPKRGIEMQYAGGGEIYYTSLVLRYVYIDEPLFHEFFHLFQSGNLPPQRILNNEVEAYMAQYLYARSKGDDSFAVLANREVQEAIEVLASFIDPATGCVRPDMSSTGFVEAYKNVLGKLSKLSTYADYKINPVNSSNPFPNIVKLFRN